MSSVCKDALVSMQKCIIENIPYSWFCIMTCMLVYYVVYYIVIWYYFNPLSSIMILINIVLWFGIMLSLPYYINPSCVVYIIMTILHIVFGIIV